MSFGINPVFTGLSPTYGQVTYALLTRAPVSPRRDIPRLACVRPVASVHPEPGSNSSLYFLFIFYFPCGRITKRSTEVSPDCQVLFLTDGKALHSLYPRIVLLVYFADKSFKDRFPLN